MDAKNHFIGINLSHPLCERLNMAVHIEDTGRSAFIRQAVRNRAERILGKQAARPSAQTPRVETHDGMLSSQNLNPSP